MKIQLKGFIYEDELNKENMYDALYSLSRVVDGVRVFPERIEKVDDNRFIFGGTMSGKESHMAINTINKMKKMKIGESIWLASKGNDSLFIKIPMVQKDVQIIITESD